jgi:hypothetical protein
VGFENTMPALERAKIVHALDRTASVIGSCLVNRQKKRGLVNFRFHGTMDYILKLYSLILDTVYQRVAKNVVVTEEEL